MLFEKVQVFDIRINLNLYFYILHVYQYVVSHVELACGFLIKLYIYFWIFENTPFAGY